MRRRLVLAGMAATMLAAGCGTPSTLPKQAEEVHSYAAEGALLADGAAKGNTLSTFVRAHERALSEKLEALLPAIGDARLRRAANDALRGLAELGSAPSDHVAAARAARRLARVAEAAEDLAG